MFLWNELWINNLDFRKTFYCLLVCLDLILQTSLGYHYIISSLFQKYFFMMLSTLRAWATDWEVSFPPTPDPLGSFGLYDILKQWALESYQKKKFALSSYYHKLCSLKRLFFSSLDFVLGKNGENKCPFRCLKWKIIGPKLICINRKMIVQL